MTPRNEEMKKQDIIDNLAWDDSVNANDVDVKVQDDTAILNGSVPTYAAKMASERNALSVPGIINVDNRLEISFPPEVSLPTDAEITDSVERKLLWDSRVNSVNIDVQTVDGVVTLSGVVDTYWERNLAEDITLSTNGVIGIVNDLTVSLAKSVVDIDIENDIKAAYRRSLLIDEDSINVDVNNGIVTLSGTAPDYLTKSRAFAIAMYTSGVTDVINNITII